MSQLGHRADQDPQITEFLRNQYAGYHETDMQFNIGRTEGLSPRGMDIINSFTRERLLITKDSSRESEQIIKDQLGRFAVLPRVDHVNAYDGVAIYYVPEGARPLVKTLQQAPFEDEYMESMYARSGAFLRSLYQLDEGLFGITLQNIAIGHSAENTDDDAMFMVVPPIAEPGSEPHKPLSAVADDSRQLLDEQFYPAFMQGLLQPPRRR